MVPDDGAWRTDPLTGARVRIVSHRQDRPNLPEVDCPFCIGGREAPEPYEVRAFPNRWPPLDGNRAEIVLFSPDHEATLATAGAAQVRRIVDLWAERSAALGARADVAEVLVFENRGREVGATIDHPHGQIYAFESVSPALQAEFRHGAMHGVDDDAIGDRLVTDTGTWRAWVPAAAVWPYELLLAPRRPVPDLPSLDDDARDDLAAALVDVVGRLDALFDAPMPLMTWFHQRPFDGGDWPDARVHCHLAPLRRGPGTARFVAAGELGSGLWFNPVDPDDAADTLRRIDLGRIDLGRIDLGRIYPGQLDPGRPKRPAP